MQIPPLNTCPPFVPLFLCILPWVIAKPISFKLFKDSGERGRVAPLVSFPVPLLMCKMVIYTLGFVVTSLGLSFCHFCLDFRKLCFNSTTPVSVMTALSMSYNSQATRSIGFFTTYANGAGIIFDIFAEPTRMLINGALASDKNMAAKGAALVGLQVLGYFAIDYALTGLLAKNKGRDRS